MKNEAKVFYEKMIDYKRFGTTLLIIGVFFYLGVIIPSDTKNVHDVNIMILSSMSFLAFSILFLTRSKEFKQKLLELDEGQE